MSPSSTPASHSHPLQSSDPTSPMASEPAATAAAAAAGEATTAPPAADAPSTTITSTTTIPTDPPVSAPPSAPMIHVRALLISGDSKVFSFDPETPVGRMKELLWSMWPSAWASIPQPPSPTYIRILYSGRVLADDSTLAGNNLPVALHPTHPTVIHISVRSFSVRGTDPEPRDAKKPGTTHHVRERSAPAHEDEVGGCKCVIM